MDSKIKNYSIGNANVTEYYDKNIIVIENVITDDFCRELIEFISLNECHLNKIEFEMYNNVECYYLNLEDLKKKKDFNNNLPVIEIDKKIFLIMGKIINILHSIIYAFKGTEDCGYTLRKIFGGTRLHADSITTPTTLNYVRCMSVVINLNDDYDGGIFHFPKQDFHIKLKKGSAIAFPPYWTHPHETSNVNEGQFRYTINTWLLQKLEK